MDNTKAILLGSTVIGSSVYLSNPVNRREITETVEEVTFNITYTASPVVVGPVLIGLVVALGYGVMRTIKKSLK